VSVHAFSSVDDLPDRAWQDLPDAGLFDSRLWLSVNESTFVGEPIVTAEQDSAGWASLMVWRVTDAQVASPYHNIAVLLRRWCDDPPRPAGRTLNCTGAGLHSPYLLAPTRRFDAKRLQAHVEAAVAATTAGGAVAPRMLGVNFLSGAHGRALAPALAELGWTEVFGYRRAKLTLPGNSVDHYLAGLRSKQRSNVRADRERFAATGMRIGFATGLDACGDDIVELQGANLLKYGLTADPDGTRARHRTLLGAFPEQSLVIRSKRADETTGFMMYFWRGRTMHALFAGFLDRPDNRGAYFECAFTATIKWAYAHGMRAIDYGVGAHNSVVAKRGRGCIIEPVSSWYRMLP
jgi:hypothetical protein